MSGIQCNKCGSTNIDTDSPCGGVVCIACGNVLEDSGIVSEVQFVQDSRGASRAVGQLVSFEDGCPFGQRYGTGRESRDITIQNARQNIELLASKLQLRSHAVETAVNYYKLALQKHLTKGRKGSHVIAACVYMVCRKDGTSHMLLDLSDALKINVYELGKTYLKLSSELRINTPAIDPILYIARFARQLQFGDKENEVAVTATKLVRRMKSDWIHFGRRPSGLCGAALLVAARMHNFNRTIDDIIKIVKVCQATVRKRLNEFGDTPSGKLSIEDFMTVDLSEEQDPPAFKNARKKLRELEDEEKMKELESQMLEYRKQIEKALESSRKKSRFETLAGSVADEDGSQLSESSNVERAIAENTLESLKDAIGQEGGSMSDVNNLMPLLTQESNSLPDSGYSEMYDSSNIGEPTLETVGLGNSTFTSTPDLEMINPDPDNKLDITGLDDKELDMYFMKQEEYEKKDAFWHKYNAEFLEEMKAREQRRALEEEENAKKPPRKKRCYKSRNFSQPSSAGEAMSKVFQQKKISHKLNYDILKSLTPDQPLPDIAENPNQESESPKPEKSPSVKSLRLGGSKRKSSYLSVPLSIRQGMSDIVGKNRKRQLAALAEKNETQEISEEKPEVLQIDVPEPLKVEEPVLVKADQPVLLEEDAILDNSINADVADEEYIEDEDSDDEYGFPKDDGPPDYDDYDEFAEPYD